MRINRGIIERGHCFDSRPKSEEYKTAMKSIQEALDDHRAKMVPGKPQLNMCDAAVQVRTTCFDQKQKSVFMEYYFFKSLFPFCSMAYMYTLCKTPNGWQIN